jgi:hypothetical protein
VTWFGFGARLKSEAILIVGLGWLQGTILAEESFPFRGNSGMQPDFVG